MGQSEKFRKRFGDRKRKGLEKNKEKIGDRKRNGFKNSFTKIGAAGGAIG
jgi:hypothetical protein